MAYNAGGKTFTDNPLMDEITYNCKRILNGIVIKNDVLANNSETENSLTNAEMYKIQHEDGIIPFSVFPFTREIFEAYGYTDNQDILAYLRDRNNIPESDRDTLVNFANNYFADNFEEENDYYRTLNGIPPYGSGEEYYVYLSKGDFPAKYKKNVDYRIPVHLQPSDVIGVLYNIGKIDELRKTYKTSKYAYLDHIGPKSIDIYEARKANKWDILYLPNVYYLIEDKFSELYKINRDIYLNQSYQESFADTGDYYDELMILTVLAQTFADMVTSTPEWYIRRDIFDIRSVKYFLESYGVEFFKEIPLKYQTRIVKNVNKLIKYKSSNMNLTDIIDVIIKEDNIRILKYWLFKSRKMNDQGHYTPGDTDKEKYDLEFISSPVYESYDSYIKDFIYRTPYDDITYFDKYWDAEDTHTYIHDNIVDEDFTVQGTKYMSIEYKVSWEEYMFQVEYFLGLILDSKVDMEDIRVAVPTIDENTDFSISNLFLYLIIVSDCLYRYDINDDSINIRRITPMEGNMPTIDEDHYNWKKKYIPELYINKGHRVHAFNPRFDRQGMEKFVKTRRHSHYIFGASYNNVDFDNPGQDMPLSDRVYPERSTPALDELMINQFITPAAKYSYIEEVIDVYRNNRECYENLMNKVRWCNDENELSTLAYIYQEMYTRDFDEDFFKLANGTPANDLAEILNERDYILWENYRALMEETNIEARKDLIRQVLNDVVESLEYYINGEGLDYIFAFTPIDSFFNIVYYIYLLIGFFKSYKVHFLDPFVTYVVDNKMDPLNHMIPTNDLINEWKATHWKEDKAFTSDSLTVEPEYFEKDYSQFKVEGVDVYAYQDRDPFEDMDYDGIHAEDGEAEGYTDVDGGIAETDNNVGIVDIDAGHSYLGMTDINNIDGGEADEGFHTYYDIDCGNAYHAEDERVDWYGTQGFNYDIDGGGSSPYFFHSKSLNINVRNNGILIDALISGKEDNKVMILDDGIYVPNFMVDQGDFDQLLLEYTAMTEEFGTDYSEALADIMSIKGFPDIEKRVTKLVQSKLYNMKTSTDDVLNNKLLTRIKAFVDKQHNYLVDYYDGKNPYGWEEL